MKTTRWLRIIGVFYLFLALGSIGVVFVNPNLFGSIIPFRTNELSLHAFSDAWLIFTLEMGVLGVIMLILCPCLSTKSHTSVDHLFFGTDTRRRWRLVVDVARLAHDNLYSLYDRAFGHCRDRLIFPTTRSLTMDQAVWPVVSWISMISSGELVKHVTLLLQSGFSEHGQLPGLDQLLAVC